MVKSFTHNIDTGWQQLAQYRDRFYDVAESLLLRLVVLVLSFP